MYPNSYEFITTNVNEHMELLSVFNTIYSLGTDIEESESRNIKLNFVNINNLAPISMLPLYYVAQMHAHYSCIFQICCTNAL